MRAFFLLSLIFVSLGCEEPRGVPDNALPPKAPTSNDAAAEALVDSPPPAPSIPEIFEVSLDEELAFDFNANASRLHTYDEGFLVQFAEPGFWKYTQEYSRPFGEAVEFEDERGRVLERRAAKLNVPLRNLKSVKIKVKAHGVSSGQRLQINVNSKLVGVQDLEKRWQTLEFEVPGGLLKDGENEVLISLHNAGRVGGKRTYGLISSMEFVGEEPPTTSKSLWIELPEKSVFEAESDGAFEIQVRTADSLETAETIAHEGKVRADLSQWGGKVVELQFRKGASFENARIAMHAVESAPQWEPIENAILLVIDAQRSDRLELYADTRVKTPNMTREGKHAFVFRNNQAASPSSPPSHASIQTGMIPRVHGVTGDKGQLKSDTPLLSSQLEDFGVFSAYVGNNSFGMGRLRKAGKWSKFVQPVSEGKGIDCTAVNEETLKVIDEARASSKRFFVSMLPFEPHAPYRFHEGITEKYHEGGWGPPVGKFADGYLLVDIMAGRKKMSEENWSQLLALYDGEVEYMDVCFGALVDALKERGIWEETAIVVTSDHGEGMNERGRVGHAYGHYHELADVPFTVYAPALLADGPVRFESPTSVLDIAPTILELMGASVSKKVQGESMLGAMRKRASFPRVVSSEYGRSYGLRARHWRMIVNYDGSEELYDLTKDPTEKNNLVETDAIGLRYLRDSAGFFLEFRSDWTTSNWAIASDSVQNPASD